MKRQGWYIALGDEDRLIVVFSELGLPEPAVRFRTAVHAHIIASRHNEGRDPVREAFGPGEANT